MIFGGVAAALFLAFALPAPSTAQTTATSSTDQPAAPAAPPAPTPVQSSPPVVLASHGPWTPDPTLVGQLAKATIFDDYAINAPIGFKSLDRDSPDGFGHVYGWTLPPLRPNGSLPTLEVVLATAPKGQENQFTADQILGNFVGIIRATQINWISTQPERGNVNGVPFEREYWTGVDDIKGFTSRGFVYISEPSIGKFIIIDGRDAEPYADSDIPTIESAALTLRPKSAPAPVGAPH